MHTIRSMSFSGEIMHPQTPRFLSCHSCHSFFGSATPQNHDGGGEGPPHILCEQYAASLPRGEAGDTSETGNPPVGQPREGVDSASTNGLNEEGKGRGTS